MVLRDARMHTLVDDRNSAHRRAGTMSDPHAVPAVLQLQGGVQQEPGKEVAKIIHRAGRRID